MVVCVGKRRQMDVFHGVSGMNAADFKLQRVSARLRDEKRRWWEEKSNYVAVLHVCTEFEASKPQSKPD